MCATSTTSPDASADAAACSTEKDIKKDPLPASCIPDPVLDVEVPMAEPGTEEVTKKLEDERADLPPISPDKEAWFSEPASNNIGPWS